jgi:predicted metal-dependent hydrolase
MNKIVFKELEIEHICNPRLKHSYLSVKNSSEIVLKTPKVSNSFIQNLLLEKETWIKKQLLKFESSNSRKVNLEDEALLFGDVISIDSMEVEFLRNKLLALKNTQEKNVLKSYDEFYKYFANQYLPQRVEYFANAMNLEFAALKFRKMKSRWGSCSSTKIITLNSELIKVKKELIDYVIVHELAHLVHMNHSKKFHELVESHLRDSQKFRQELKKTNLRAF